jgi:hypothetical protein
MEHKLVEESLEDLRKRGAEQPPDQSFVEAALDRADRRVEEGKREEAVRIWQGIVDLYGNDPRAATLVERARRKLATAPANATPANTVPAETAPAKKLFGKDFPELESP